MFPNNHPPGFAPFSSPLIRIRDPRHHWTRRPCTASLPTCLMATFESPPPPCLSASLRIIILSSHISSQEKPFIPPVVSALPAHTCRQSHISDDYAYVYCLSSLSMTDFFSPFYPACHDIFDHRHVRSLLHTAFTPLHSLGISTKIMSLSQPSVPECWIPPCCPIVAVQHIQR